MQKLITCLCLCFVATVFCQIAERSNPSDSNDSFEAQNQLTASTAIGIGSLIKIQVFNNRIEVPALDFKVEFPIFNNEQLIDNWMVVSKSLSNVLIQAWQQDNTRKRIAEIALDYYRKKVVDSYNDSEFERLFNEQLSNTSAESFFTNKPEKTASFLYDDIRKSCLKEAEEKVTIPYLEENKNDIPSLANIDDKVSIEIDSGKVFNGRLFQIYPNRVKISGQWIPRSSMALKSRAMFWKEDREEYITSLLKNDNDLQAKITALFKSDFSKALPKELFKYGYIQKCPFSQEILPPSLSTESSDWVSRQEWFNTFQKYIFQQVCLRYYGHYKYVYHINRWMPDAIRNKLYYGIRNIYNFKENNVKEWNKELESSHLLVGNMEAFSYIWNNAGIYTDEYGAYIFYNDSVPPVTFEPVVWRITNTNNINGQWRGYQKCHLLCDFTWNIKTKAGRGGTFHNKELVIYLLVVRGLINGKEYNLYDLTKCIAIPKFETDNDVIYDYIEEVIRK